MLLLVLILEEHFHSWQHDDATPVYLFWRMNDPDPTLLYLRNSNKSNF